MFSRPLNIENKTSQNLSNLKRTTNPTVLQATQNLHETNEIKSEQIDSIKRSNVHDDLDHIQERLHEMLITAPQTNGNESSLIPTEQCSTTEYFTPKISIDENGKKKTNDNETDDDDGDDH